MRLILVFWQLIQPYWTRYVDEGWRTVHLCCHPGQQRLLDRDQLDINLGSILLTKTHFKIPISYKTFLAWLLLVIRSYVWRCEETIMDFLSDIDPWYELLFNWCLSQFLSFLGYLDDSHYFISMLFTVFPCLFGQEKNCLLFGWGFCCKHDFLLLFCESLYQGICISVKALGVFALILMR